MNIVCNTQMSRRPCPVRDKMLVENEMHPPCPPVPNGLKDVYEAQLWDETENCVWTYKSPQEGGTELDNTIVERPKVTFHTDGGSRPLYTYIDADNEDIFFWYVNADSLAYSNTNDSVPVTVKDGYEFLGWYSDAELSAPYENAAVALGGIYIRQDIYTSGKVKTAKAVKCK